MWPTPPRGRAALVGDILSYALRRHMRLGDAPVSVPSLDVEALLPRAAPAAGAGAGATPTSPAPVAPSAAPPTVLALAALARVAAALTAAPALPLRVTSVAPCAPGLTYTAVVEPTPHPLAGGDLEAAWSAGVREVPRVLRPLFAVVSLERSAKWPGSLEGIAAVKTALLVAMAEALAAARIDARPAPGWLDVLVDGFVCARGATPARSSICDPRTRAARIGHMRIPVCVRWRGVCIRRMRRAIVLMRIPPIRAGTPSGSRCSWTASWRSCARRRAAAARCCPPRWAARRPRRPRRRAGERRRAV